MKPLHFLIVDDNKALRVAISALVEEYSPGCVIAQAPNGEVAVEIAAKQEFDLILIDISMPVMDGFQATSAIKAMKPEQRIVAVSMHTDRKDIEKMKAAGAVGYVVKDQIGDRMGEMLENVLNGQRYFLD